MPDAINHLSAFNRIAYALEHMPPDDQAALIAALDAIANKTIPVADMTGIVTAINNKQIPSTDLTGVVTAINNISIPGGGGASSGSLDCECLADVLAPLIEKIDQLVCVIVPIANSQYQIQKIINYIGMDGPTMGIDAPPGTFVFPIPGDSAPSLPYTPDPNPIINPTDPETGAWTSPPIINGISYDAPPGGMQGAADSAAYNQYKCDAAFAIIYWLKGYYDNIGWIVPKLTLLVDMGIAGFLGAVYWLGNLPTGPVIKGILGPYRSTVLIELIGARAATALTNLVYAASAATLNLIVVILVEILALGAIVAGGMTQMMNLLEAHKAELACALIKARTIEEARNNFLDVIDKYADTLLEKFLGRLGNGQIALINVLLTDNMLAILFACPVDLDPADIAGLGAANGGCVDCTLCGDTTEQLTVNKSSIASFDPLTPGNYEPYPLTVEIGTIHSDIICCVAEAAFANGSGRIDVIIGGVVVAVTGWGDTLEYGEVRIVPVAPATVFDGAVTLKMYHAGTLANGAFTLHSVGWRDVP